MQSLPAQGAAGKQMRGDLEAIFGNSLSEDEKACNSQNNSLGCCIKSTDSLMRVAGTVARTGPQDYWFWLTSAEGVGS